MMNPRTGDYAMLDASDEDAARRQLEDARRLGEDLVLLQGTEEQIKALSTRVRLGDAELERRRARRQQQRKSRRDNR